MSLLDQQKILDSWQPEPLVPQVDRLAYQHILSPKIVTSKSGKYIIVDGKRCLNLGTHNYLGLADNPRLQMASIEAVQKYGVGSCGPRAFYGTMDIHLILEEELAKFLNVQEVLLYAYGFSTIASAIPAYAKATDVIFVDEQCNFAIQQGMIASRSEIIKFDHNNTQDLEQRIKDFENRQLRKYGQINKVRSFIIVEAIYSKTGSICPLKELIRIKKEHKIRLFIDETRSFGLLGAEGKGITQHFNVDVQDVDMIMASLENGMCSYGGFCAGQSFVIDHQRLAGSGYIFSASLPPSQAKVALESLNIIREDVSIISEAQEKFLYAHEKLKSIDRLVNISDPLSPIKLLTPKETMERRDQELFLQKICDQLLDREQIAVSISKYLEEEFTPSTPSIKLIISAALSREDIDRVSTCLNETDP